MRTVRLSALAVLLASLVLAGSPAMPSFAAPAEQAGAVSVTPTRLQVFPLGTALVQLVLSNPSRSAETFALEFELLRADGSLAVAYLSDPLTLEPGTTTMAYYAIRHADGAVNPVVRAKRWPELPR